MLLRTRSNSLDVLATAPGGVVRIPLLTIANNGLKRFKLVDSLISEDTAHFACNVELEGLDLTTPGRKGYFALISSDALLLYRQSKKISHAHHRVLFPLRKITSVTKKNEFTVVLQFASSSSQAAGVSFSTGEPIKLCELELAFLENNVYNIDPFLQRIAFARGDVNNEAYFSPERLEEKLRAVLNTVDTSQTSKLQVFEAVTKESANIENQAKVALAFKLMEIAICCVSYYGDQVPGQLEADLVANCEFLQNSVGTFARCVRYISQTVAQIGELRPKGPVAGRAALRMMYGISDTVAVRMSTVEKAAVLGQEPLNRVLQQLEQLKFGDRLVAFQKETLDGLKMTAGSGGGQKKFYEVLSLGFQHPLRRLTLLRAAQNEFEKEDPKFVLDYIANVERLSNELNAAVAANDLNMDRIEMMVKGCTGIAAEGRVCLANELALLRSGNLHGKLLVFDDCIVFATVSNSITKFHSAYELALQHSLSPDESDIVLTTKLQKQEAFYSAKPELKQCINKLLVERKFAGMPKRECMPTAKVDSFLSRLSPAFARGASPKALISSNGAMQHQQPVYRAGSGGGAARVGGGSSSRSGLLGSFGRSATPEIKPLSTNPRTSLENKLGGRAKTPLASSGATVLAPRVLTRPSATVVAASNLPAQSPMDCTAARHNAALNVKPVLLQKF